jgi:uncharacterized membrane protein
LVKRFFLFLLGVAYLAAGIAHFWNPEFYIRIMPPYLPAHRELVELSGVAEFALGFAMLVFGVRVPRIRRWTAWGIIALLIAVFPANLYVATQNLGGPDFTPGAGNAFANWARLPVQIVFLVWAWWYTQPDAGEA